MAAKKKVNLGELKMELLKKVIEEVDSISDVYQRNQIRLDLIQTINGISSTSTSLPEGRDALDNTKKKEDNIAEESEKQVKETTQETATVADKISKETQEAVNNIKDAVTEILGEQEQTLEAVEEIQEVVEETQEGTILEEDMFLDAGDGNLINIKDAYNSLVVLPDDESKQYLAFYLSYYDAESVAAIVAAFSSNITSNPYELLNSDNYEAFLDYFRSCLEG